MYVRDSIGKNKNTQRAGFGTSGGVSTLQKRQLFHLVFGLSPGNTTHEQQTLQCSCVYVLTEYYGIYA